MRKLLYLLLLIPSVSLADLGCTTLDYDEKDLVFKPEAEQGKILWEFGYNSYSLAIDMPSRLNTPYQDDFVMAIYPDKKIIAMQSFDDDLSEIYGWALAKKITTNISAIEKPLYKKIRNEFCNQKVTFYKPQYFDETILVSKGLITKYGETGHVITVYLQKKDTPVVTKLEFDGHSIKDVENILSTLNYAGRLRVEGAKVE